MTITTAVAENGYYDEFIASLSPEEEADLLASMDRFADRCRADGDPGW
jgi:hypothetical protein